jgi:hypothetical protein
VDLEKYPYIVPHKFNPRQVYCQLTRATLNFDKEVGVGVSLVFPLSRLGVM